MFRKNPWLVLVVDSDIHMLIRRGIDGMPEALAASDGVNVAWSRDAQSVVAQLKNDAAGGKLTTIRLELQSPLYPNAVNVLEQHRFRGVQIEGSLGSGHILVTHENGRSRAFSVDGIVPAVSKLSEEDLRISLKKAVFEGTENLRTIITAAPWTEFLPQDGFDKDPESGSVSGPESGSVSGPESGSVPGPGSGLSQDTLELWNVSFSNEIGLQWDAHANILSVSVILGAFEVFYRTGNRVCFTKATGEVPTSLQQYEDGHPDDAEWLPQTVFDSPLESRCAVALGTRMTNEVGRACAVDKRSFTKWTTILVTPPYEKAHLLRHPESGTVYGMIMVSKDHHVLCRSRDPEAAPGSWEWLGPDGNWMFGSGDGAMHLMSPKELAAPPVWCKPISKFLGFGIAGTVLSLSVSCDLVSWETRTFVLPSAKLYAGAELVCAVPDRGDHVLAKVGLVFRKNGGAFGLEVNLGRS